MEDIIQGRPFASRSTRLEKRGQPKRGKGVVKRAMSTGVVIVASHNRVQSRVGCHKLLDLVRQVVKGRGCRGAQSKVSKDIDRNNQQASQAGGNELEAGCSKSRDQVQPEAM